VLQDEEDDEHLKHPV
jgi:hypothetical protein